MLRTKEPSNSPEGSRTPDGQNPVLDWMRAHQIPLTRKQYLYLDGLEDPLPIELERRLPVEIRKTSWTKDELDDLISLEFEREMNPDA